MKKNYIQLFSRVTKVRLFGIFLKQMVIGLRRPCRKRNRKSLYEVEVILAFK